MSAVLWVSLCEQRNAAGDQDQHVEDDICLCHLLHPVCWKRVYKTTEECECCHDSDDGASGRIIGESTRIVKLGAHGHRSKQELCRTVFRGGDASYLTQ